MKKKLINDRDRLQIEALGIPEDEILRQIERFEKGVHYLKLKLPCTVNNGIRAVSEDKKKQLAHIYEEYAPKMDVVKLVPASGASSRMFKTLLKFKNEHREISRELVESRARKGNLESRELATFMTGIYQFAFSHDLKFAMFRDGLDMEALVDAGEFKEIIDYLLTEKGLNYANLPKGLIKFHFYEEGARTAFEEHLVEAEGYARNEHNRCRIHFTVSPEYKERFLSVLTRVRKRYEEGLGIEIKADFSFQDKSTDTLAVDMADKPFRLNDGTLLFRPGGHGALLKNLSRVKGDIIFIKNIDNVVPDRLKEHTFLWKKILGGILIQTQQKMFAYIKKLLANSRDAELFGEILEFISSELCITLPVDSEGRTRKAILEVLNRPLRVCGMVKNVGEPGGGPFWVEGNDGKLSLQIVESVQVDPYSEEQQKILASSTHFNPVDIVCTLRDWRGRPFNLERYVDNEAVFISEKSKDGRTLKALELPGLWNGSMAYWNTIFVEVPLITFNPVKTVNDLLREEHQPRNSKTLKSGNVRGKNFYN